MSGAVEVIEADAEGLSRTLKDLGSGAAGGIAQVLIGQPFGQSNIESDLILVAFPR